MLTDTTNPEVGSGDDIVDELDSFEDNDDNNDDDFEEEYDDVGAPAEFGEEEDDDEFPESVFGAEEKRRLEKLREKRRLSMEMEKECMRESRVIFFRMKEHMSPEQLRRIRLVMGKLIAMSPPIADDHSKLAKAFVIWSEKLPLFLKCNELRRQFDERGIALEVLRDSYYRDVLSVKQHIERVYKNQDMPVDLKELCGSVPSMDFRKLVARAHTDDSSNQLRDGLMETGLISEKAKKKWSVNPWEQGHAYQMYKRINPERLRSGGASLNLYAPNRHRLYIKYCRSCVGVMSLVHDWNKDVEIALGAKLTEDTTEELKRVVRNLNTVIIDLSNKVERQTAEIEGYEKGSKWWTEWAKKQTISEEAGAKINQLRALSRRWEDTARMAKEDHSAVVTSFHRYKAESSRKQDQLQTSYAELSSASAQTTALLNCEINELKEKFKEREAHEQEREEEMERVKWERQKLKDDNGRLKRLNAQLNSSLDEKDRQMAQYREETINRIENLKSQITDLSADVENSERECDRMADLLEAAKNAAAVKADSLNALHEEMTTLRSAIQVKDEAISTLKKPDEAEEESDDESEGITEEILEDYKEALQYMPRAMRLEVAKNLERFGLIGEDVDVEGNLDSLLDAGGSGENLSRCHTNGDDDDFNFQHIQRRVSEFDTQSVQRDQGLASKSCSVECISEGGVEDESAVTEDVAGPGDSPSNQSPGDVSGQQATIHSARPHLLKRGRSAKGSFMKQRPSLSVEQELSLDTSSHARIKRSSSVEARRHSVVLRQNSRQASRAIEIQSFSDEKIEEMREEGLRKAKLKKNILQLVPILAPFIKPAKVTLKVVAIAVRFAIRFKNAIDAHDFKALGSLGRKEEIRRVHERYLENPSVIKRLESKVASLELNEKAYKSEIASCKEELKKLKLSNEEHVLKAEGHLSEVEKLKRDVLRQHIIGQCQRSFAADLSETMSVMRNRIFMLIRFEGDIPVPLKEEEAKKLEDRSMLKELSEEDKEAEKLHLRQRVNVLFRKLRLHVREVSKFAQENKRLRPISSFALGKFSDFHSFGSKFRNELRNLKLFKKRALADLSIVEKRWVVKTLKVCTSETNYRDLFFSRLCPACKDGCERGLDGKWAFKKGGRVDKEDNGMHSPKGIKALTDHISKRVRDEVGLEFQDEMNKLKGEAVEFRDHIDSLAEIIKELEGKLSDSAVAVNILQEEAAVAKEKYDISKREVFVLRRAVQDSYRAIEENALQEAEDRESKWRGQGTQISCSVCAIRYEKTEHGHDGDLTIHLEASDRILFPRAASYLRRVREVETMERKKKKFELAYAPFVGPDSEEPDVPLTKHRTTNNQNATDCSPKKSKKKTKASRSVETGVGVLAVPAHTSTPVSSSKFSQMKNMPSGGHSKSGGLSSAGNKDSHMTRMQVSKVAALLQKDNKISNIKKLQGDQFLDMTSTETAQVMKLLGSASRNKLENRKQTDHSWRPISAPNYKR